MFGWFLKEENLKPSPIAYYTKTVERTYSDPTFSSEQNTRPFSRSYFFNDQQQLTKGILHYPNSSKDVVHIFDSFGNLVEKSIFEDETVVDSHFYIYNDRNEMACELNRSPNEIYYYKIYSYGAVQQLSKVQLFFGETVDITELILPIEICDSQNTTDLIWQDTYTYSDSGQKEKTVRHNIPSDAISTVQYSYDAKGNLVKETCNDASEQSILIKVHNYDYDGNLVETQSILPKDKNAFEEVTKYSYFKDGAISEVQILNSNSELVWLKRFDSYGTIVKDATYAYIEKSSTYRDNIRVYEPHKKHDFFEEWIGFNESLFYDEEYDYSNGNLIEQKTLLIGSPSNIEYLNSKKTFIYDSMNNLIQTSYFDEDMLESETFYKLNKYGNEVEILQKSYEDADVSEHITPCSYIYDNYNNWTQKECFIKGSLMGDDFKFPDVTELTTRTINYYK